MDIVAVIDIKDGVAVHARGGDRATYAPIHTAAGMRIEGDVVALARVYIDALGARTLYVADLDAIAIGVEALHRSLISRVSALGAAVWVDAGVTAPAAALEVLGTGASMVIVGLETLTSFDSLAEICEAVGSGRVVFSLDLRDGVPMAEPNVDETRSSPVDIARAAYAAGARTIMLLDVARAGRAEGIDVPMARAVRQAVPDAALFVGGGIRSQQDVDALATLGCDGVLVATALMSGAIRA